MTKLETFLAFIKQHYQVIDYVSMSKIRSRFNLRDYEAIAGMLEEGWQHETLNGYDDKFYHPNVKDKNSMLDATDFKKLNVAEEIIDETEEEKL